MNIVDTNVSWKRRTLWLIPTTVFAMADCARPPQAAPQSIEVEVADVQQKDVPVYGQWIGTLEGLVNSDMKAQVTGYLVTRPYQEGSFVRKGQLLFQIDPRPFQAALDQAEGHGLFAGTNDVIETIGGRPPMSLEAFIEKHRKAFE